MTYFAGVKHYNCWPSLVEVHVGLLLSGLAEKLNVFQILKRYFIKQDRVVVFPNWRSL